MIAVQKYFTAVDIPYHLLLVLVSIALFAGGVTFIYTGSQRRLKNDINNNVMWVFGVIFIVLAIINSGFSIFAHIPKP